MPGWTNRGKFLMLQWVFHREPMPASFFVALFTNASPPSVDSNNVSQLTEIAAGNGYTSGGFELNPDETDFDVLTEDDANDRAVLQAKNVVWTASAGPIPASGSGARWAALTTDDATVGDRQVLAFWDLGGDQSVSDTQTLTLQNCELRGEE